MCDFVDSIKLIDHYYSFGVSEVEK